MKTETVMSRYNHFSECKYGKILFRDLAVGDKFRMTRFIGKKRRNDLVMVKTSVNTCEEFKSKTNVTICDASRLTVSSYNQQKST